jgi:hypothetical protein
MRAPSPSALMPKRTLVMLLFRIVMSVPPTETPLLATLTQSSALQPEESSTLKIWQFSTTTLDAFVLMDTMSMVEYVAA